MERIMNKKLILTALLGMNSSFVMAENNSVLSNPEIGVVLFLFIGIFSHQNPILILY